MGLGEAIERIREGRERRSKLAEGLGLAASRRDPRVADHAGGPLQQGQQLRAEAIRGAVRRLDRGKTAPVAESASRTEIVVESERPSTARVAARRAVRASDTAEAALSAAFDSNAR